MGSKAMNGHAMNGGPALQYTPVDQIEELVDGLKKTFFTGKMRPLKKRIEQIKQVAFMVKDHEKEWEAALAHDLGRSAHESYLVEFSLIYADANELVKKLPKWSKPELAQTDMTWKLLRPRTYKEPKGTVLIVAPFNYPMSLSLVPLMGALAGGNTVLFKPSEQTTAVAALFARLMPQYLDPSVVKVVNGAKDETTRLLELPFDHIFFTGSPAIGKIIATAAAKHFCPVTLELGGKSPAVVFDDANIEVAAKRIAWGKVINAAQTCIAPDYCLMSKALQPKFIEAYRKALRDFFPKGENPIDSKEFATMVTDNAFGRLNKLLSETSGELVVGGTADQSRKRIDVTLYANVKEDDALMSQELFGPVLPIITCETKEDAVRIISQNDKPLVLYCFTNDSKKKDYIFDRTRSGAFVHNDTLVHFIVQGLPFGGVGKSGVGNYHGKKTFDTFVHERAYLSVPFMMEPMISLRYPPYTPSRTTWYRRMLGHSIGFSRPNQVGFLQALLGKGATLKALLIIVAVVSFVQRSPSV